MFESYQLPKRIQNIWRIQAGISFLLLCLLAAIVWGIRVFWSADFLYWVQWGTYALVVVVPLFSLLTVPYRYRNTQYRLTPSAILLQTGFIFKEQVAVPIARVQDVTLSAGPLLQANNLQQITIATAATQHDIDGVSPEDAQHLREEILKLAQEEQNRDV